jgi:pSer/pThr/pTyr-binding forkhead associated (FHA) protein
MPRLVIRQEKSPRASLELEPRMNVRMGRGAENEVVLDDPRSSRVHAIVSHSGQEWIVTDMDSRNGTRLNGKQVQEARLKHGDRIEIGKAVIEFESESEEREPAPAAPSREPGTSSSRTATSTRSHPRPPRSHEAIRARSFSSR